MLTAEMGRLLRFKHIKVVLALLTLFIFVNDLVNDAMHDLKAPAHSQSGLLCENEASPCSASQASTSETADHHSEIQHASSKTAHNHGHSQCATCTCSLHNGAALDTVAHIRIGVTGMAEYHFPQAPIHAPDAPLVPIEYPPQLG